MSKNKYYAIVKGRNPGIYDKWFGIEGAEAQIKGFPGAVYKGFYSRDEAIYWFSERTGDSPSNRAITRKESNSEERLPQRDVFSKVSGQPHEAELEKGKVVIYVDGGCIQNPGPGGYGAIILQAEKRKELSGGYSRTTNNRMELMACIKSLETLEQRFSVVIYSDSQYVVNGIKKGWAKRWQANNWKRNHTEKAENADLWALLLDLCESHDVEFVWVRGHDGIKENERCDRLSYEMARRNDLPPDHGFSREVF